MGQPLRKVVPAARVAFSVEPLTLNRSDALAYTGIADKLFSELEKAGTITGRKVGRQGEIVYLREHLQAATLRLFGGSATDIDDEFDGLNG